MSIIIDSASLIGKRKTNEDKHVIFCNINGKDKTKIAANIYAIFDGHGGRFVSKFLSDYMVQIMTHPKVKLPLTRSFATKVIRFLQSYLKKNYYQNAKEVGSTCLFAVHFIKNYKEYLNIINVGDSRCILCKKNKYIPLTIDHKPNYPTERERILNLGGKIIYDAGEYRVQNLSLSRAIGDISAEPYVTCDPDLWKYSIVHEYKFIIFGCDGLFEGIPDIQELIGFILANAYDKTGVRTTNKIAKKLAEYAIQRGSTDNVSVIIVFLR